MTDAEIIGMLDGVISDRRAGLWTRWRALRLRRRVMLREPPPRWSHWTPGAVWFRRVTWPRYAAARAGRPRDELADRRSRAPG